MLGFARRDHGEPADRDLAGVPDGVGRSPRYEHQAADAERELTITELEGPLSVGKRRRPPSVCGCR
jgi:hypothetical protein